MPNAATAPHQTRATNEERNARRRAARAARAQERKQAEARHAAETADAQEWHAAQHRGTWGSCHRSPCVGYNGQVPAERKAAARRAAKPAPDAWLGDTPAEVDLATQVALWWAARTAR